MNLSKKIIATLRQAQCIALVVLLLATYGVLAQDTIQKYPKVLNYMGDSVIVFSFSQGLEITANNEKRKECLELNENNIQIIAQKDTVIVNQENKIKNYKKIEQDLNVIIEKKDDLNDICEEEKNGLRREVRKQKAQKWVAIIGGVAVAALILIL